MLTSFLPPLLGTSLHWLFVIAASSMVQPSNKRALQTIFLSHPQVHAHLLCPPIVGSLFWLFVAAALSVTNLPVKKGLLKFLDHMFLSLSLDPLIGDYSPNSEIFF